MDKFYIVYTSPYYGIYNEYTNNLILRHRDKRLIDELKNILEGGK
jgi:hypothetical protein